jgi:hypothetical protein
MVILKENVQKMQHELLPIISEYDGRFISKANLTYYLLQQPSPWIADMSPNYRGRLITTAMFGMGWRAYSGKKDKAVRSFVRA